LTTIVPMLPTEAVWSAADVVPGAELVAAAPDCGADGEPVPPELPHAAKTAAPAIAASEMIKDCARAIEASRSAGERGRPGVAGSPGS
jgi:hypothetical protein